MLKWIKSIFGAGTSAKSQQSEPISLTESGKPWFWEVGYINGYSYSSYSMREFVINGYASNPFVFMCCDKIASVAAQLDWEIVDEKTKKPINDPALEELLLHPNPDQTWDDFYYELLVSLCSTGNAFIRKEKAIGYSKTTNMVVLVPYLVDIMTVGGQKDGIILNYTYDGLVIPKEEILHIKYANIVERTHWGFSKLQPGQRIYEASNNIFDAEAHLHKNLGITGVLTNKDATMPITTSEKKDLQEAHDRAFGGTKNFGKIMLTSASLDYLRLGMSPEDLQTLEGQTAKMRYICGLFGLDSALFNDPDNKTFSNRTQAEVSMYEGVIKPITEKANRAISADIVQNEFGKKNAVIKSDFSNVACLVSAKAEKDESTRKDLAAGIITVQEARSFIYPNLNSNG